MYKKTIKLLILICMISLQSIGGEKMKTVKSVSMVQLIANPEKYDGELIIVIGYTIITDRTSKIYISYTDYVHNIPMNSLWIDLDYKEKKKYAKNLKHYSIIEGTFSAKKGANLVNYGTIEKVTRFDIWDYNYDAK